MTAFGSGDLHDAWDSVRWLLDHDPFYPNRDETNYRWAMQVLLGLIEAADAEEAATYREWAAALVSEAKAACEDNGIPIDPEWWEAAAHRLGVPRDDRGPLAQKTNSDTLLAVMSATGQLGNTPFVADGPWEVHWSADRRTFDIVVTPQAEEGSSDTHFVLTTIKSPNDGSVCVSEGGSFILSVFATNYQDGSDNWSVIVLHSKAEDMTKRVDCLPLASFVRL